MYGEHCAVTWLTPRCDQCHNRRTTLCKCLSLSHFRCANLQPGMGMPGLRQIRVGTAGWSYKDWEGIFYPAGMARHKQHPLDFLAQCFDVVEINTSFYGHIKPELAKLWAKRADAVNPNFQFTAKLHRSFTHSPAAFMEPTSAATIRPTDEDEK